jgi:TPR repeat protein
VNDGQSTEQQTTAQDLAGITDRALSLAREGHTNEAIALLTKASQSGYAAATFGLGLVADSQGSADAASRWYARAAEQGSTEAMFNLGVEAADRGDESKAQHWYETAAQGGHAGTGTGLAPRCITARRCSAWA